MIPFLSGDMKRRLYQQACCTDDEGNQYFGRIYVNNNHCLQTDRVVKRLIRRGYFKMSIKREMHYARLANRFATKKSGKCASYIELTDKGRADARRILKL
jgi:hypothetical protein